MRVRAQASVGRALYTTFLWCLCRLVNHLGPLCVLLQGAFSIAHKANVPVIPITLIGTGRLMPNGQEGRLYWGSGVKIVVHPRIEPGTPADRLTDQARKTIASRIPPELVA